jgi:hypothetical protein
VELAPSTVRIGKLPKRTYGSIICNSSRESKEPIQLGGDKEQSSERISARGPIGLRQVVSEHRKISFFSVAGKRKNLSHATEKKRQENTRSTRGEGNAKKKG